MSPSSRLNDFACEKMAKLTELKAVALKLRDIHKSIDANLKEENAEIEQFKVELERDMKRTSSNIKAMKKAVEDSRKPGPIVYKQKPPVKEELSGLEVLAASIDAKDMSLRLLRKEEIRLAKIEKLGRTGGAVVKSYDEWFKTYGEPERPRTKADRAYSATRETLDRITGASSKDGKVSFPAETSTGTKLRAGKLTL